MSEIGLPKLYSNRRKCAAFKVDPEIWSRFKEDCAVRGISVCYVLETLMLGWLEAQKVHATIIQPVNMTINMQHVVERPRRVTRVKEPWDVARSQNWPPNCEHADEYVKATREILCLDLKDAVSLEKCWRCYLATHP